MPREAFAESVARFLDEEFAERPVLASSLGRMEAAGELDDLSQAAFEGRAARVARWLDRLAKIPAEGLDRDDQVDRELLLAELRGRAVETEWQSWRRTPDGYVGLGLAGVFTLFLHRLLPERELAAAAAARLRQVPRVLDEARHNLDPELCSGLLVKRAMAQCQAAITFAREVVPAEVSEEALGANLAVAGEAAASAYEGFMPFLEDLAARAAGSPALGEERYSRLLLSKELLPWDARQLRDRGRRQVDLIADRLAEEVDGPWRERVERLREQRPTTPEEMLRAYEAAARRAREFITRYRLVTLPADEECSVEPAPIFQRVILAVASYSQPAPFGPSRRGRFFVPWPPLGASPSEVAQRLRASSFYRIPTTSVHEAYPGHHVHLVSARENARPLRAVVGTSFFSEGWALYAEQMMADQGFYLERVDELIGQLEARRFRALRIVLDTSLHIGDMEFEEAVEILVREAGYPEPTARAEVLRYCAAPTQAVSYLTGCLLIEALKEKFLATGQGELRDYHDRLIRLGRGLPMPLAERCLQPAEE